MACEHRQHLDSGETIDYVVRLHDEYNPATVFSSIDELGRYAYANQPRTRCEPDPFCGMPLPLFSDDQDKGSSRRRSRSRVRGKITAAYQAGCAKRPPVHGARWRRRAGAGSARRRWPKPADFTLTPSPRRHRARSHRQRAVRELFIDPTASTMGRTGGSGSRTSRIAGRTSVGDAKRQSASFAHHRVEAVIQAAVNDDSAPSKTFSRASSLLGSLTLRLRRSTAADRACFNILRTWA